VFTFFRYELRFCFLVDVYSSFFFFVVCVIRFVVYVFSFMYMRGTVNSRRFFFVLSIFVFSMAVLVFSGNFFCFLIG
jgi:NADH:ubiquinone oxidoreductase subunit 5 (subunit L)/multisubunit Na+/H+ antiporter MnhA subunit